MNTGARAGGREQRGWVREIALVFCPALVALAAAWQAPVPIAVNVGKSEELYLSHYYPGEQVGGRDYRWVRGGNDSRITFAGIGWCDWHVTLVAAAGERPGGAVPLKVVSHGTTVFETSTADPDFHAYNFTVPASNTSARDVVLNFEIAEFTPPSDKRALGLAVDRVELAPSVPCVPALVAWLSLAGALTLLYAALRLYSRWVALASTFAMTALLCYLIAAQRLFVVPYAPYVLVDAALLFAGLCILHGLLSRVRLPGQPFARLITSNWPLLAMLTLLACALIFFGVQAAFIARKPFPYDFVLYYRAAERLNAGQPLYDLAALQQKPLEAAFSVYKYPPTICVRIEACGCPIHDNGLQHLGAYKRRDALAGSLRSGAGA